MQSRYYNPEIGRFINADDYVSTGQGLLGNNMFAYCLNNPVIFIDCSGTMVGTAVAATSTAICLGPVGIAALLLVAVVVVIVVSEPQVTIPKKNTPACASPEYTATITNVMTEKLAQVPQKNSSKHLHHIVAQKAALAGASRWIINEIFPDGVNNPLNLVYVKQSVHQRLHTTLYYKMVNAKIYNAYTSAGLDKTKQTFNVIQALLEIRLFIESLNALVPD